MGTHHPVWVPLCATYLIVLSCILPAQAFFFGRNGVYVHQLDEQLSLPSNHSFEKRQALLCGAGNPCIDESCCGPQGKCGFGPDYCGDGCISNCTATAMCGEFSEGGDVACGMNLCCSATGWCGTTKQHCINGDPGPGATLPCQAGYGSCQIISPPSCSPDGGSTNRRTVGYYQASNVRNRLCQRVSPRQIKLDGFTHLNFAFATIDPDTYKVAPADPADVPIMREFTALSKDGKLQTWIAIGGFDFSNPKTPTHTTWSDLCSTPERRAAFISSVKDFMQEHGFQGADLDWEYPVALERGGKKEDTKNFVSLLKEMRASFGTDYGISLPLAPDYWYLRWFDAKSMQKYVDFFGFMAYDLHGSWDADVGALGSVVRGHTDIADIKNDTLPLWYDGLDPAKINFGLALYGRGYTLADPSCDQMLHCKFSGPSNNGTCTNSAGVLSLKEINKLIAEKSLSPKYVESAMMKQISWDDQWIGYDDDESLAAKKRFANSQCFGGTMYWSVDFQPDADTSGDEPSDGDPAKNVVYLSPQIYTDHWAQCKAPCVFVAPPSRLPQVTTIDIPAYTTSLEVGTGTTTVIVLTPGPVTTDQMPFSNVNISSTMAPGVVFTFSPSIDLPLQTVTVTGVNGQTTSRTLTLPPWPAMTQGPPQNWTTGSGPWNSQVPPPATGEPSPFWPTIIPGNTRTAVPPPGFEPWNTNLPSTTTDPAGVTTLPWPSDVLKPVPTDVDEPEEDDDGSKGGGKTTCTLWFFNICIKWDDINIHIGGWQWSLPPGIYGPGPPPPNAIRLPPGFTIKGNLPRWPRITVGKDLLPTYPPEPTDGACKTETADICLTTTSFGVVTTNQATRTTATRVISTCGTILGCDVQDEDTTSRVTSAECARPTGRMFRRAPDDWKCDSDYQAAIVYPKDNFQWTKILEKLQERETALTKEDGFTYQVIGSKTDPKFVLFFHVDRLGIKGKAILDSLTEVQTVYWYRDAVVAVSNRMDEKDKISGQKRRSTSPYQRRTSIHRRANDLYNQATWDLSQICTPRFSNWFEDMQTGDDNAQLYYYDNTDLSGQYIYIVESQADITLSEFQGRVTKNNVLYGGSYGAKYEVETDHATVVAAEAAGSQLGVAKSASLMFTFGGLVPRPYKGDVPVMEKFLEALLLVYDDIVKKGLEGKAVVNLSLGGEKEDEWPQAIFDKMLIVLKMLDSLNVVIVVAAGNKDEEDSGDVNSYPALFGKSEIPNMITVGCSDLNGYKSPFCMSEDWMTAYAPGEDLGKKDLFPLDDMELGGSSFAAPKVAGLVAYFRGLNSRNDWKKDLENPRNVKALIRHFQRPIDPTDEDNIPIIWNGQVEGHSCLTEEGFQDFDKCGDLPVSLNDLPADGNPVAPPGCTTDTNGRLLPRQNNCPLPGAPGSPKRITYSQGPPAPTCTGECTPGKLCSGFYCQPNPTGVPPDFSVPSVPDPPGSPPDPPATPNFDVQCEGGLQENTDVVPADFRDTIKKVCAIHKELQDNITIGGNGQDPSHAIKYWKELFDGIGFWWEFFWTQEPDDNPTCDFDCETVFSAFPDSSNCVTDEGVVMNGHIQTDCGLAGYEMLLQGPP